MKRFTQITLLFAMIAMVQVVAAQNLQTSASRDANMSSRAGLTSDVDKTNLNSNVNIYSHANSVYVATSDVNLNNAKYAVYTLSGQMITMSNITGTVTRFDMEPSQKGLFIVKALVNGKVSTKKVYIY